MAGRIKVYNEADGKPAYRVNKATAWEMVDSGKAVWLLQNRTLLSLVKSQRPFLKCGQREVYESAGFLGVQTFIQGGLTRTEHQPAAFSACKAARVGH